LHDPQARLDEQDRECGGGAEVGDERRGHDPLADDRLVEARFDEDGVDHGQARRREGGAGDLRLAVVPAERVVREQAAHRERCEEGDDADRERRAPFAPELRDVDLGSRQERQHDAGERADEAEPARHRETERVTDDETCDQLDQGDREAGLHRDHRREQDGARQDCRYSDVAHPRTSTSSVAEAIGSR